MNPPTLRKPLADFALAMEAKLAAPDADRVELADYLTQGLEVELEELRRALLFGDIDQMRAECVDIANCAMMLWDRLR